MNYDQYPKAQIYFMFIPSIPITNPWIMEISQYQISKFFYY